MKDVTLALGLTPKGVAQRLEDEVISNYPIRDGLGRFQNMLVVSEFGIYQTIFQSRKKGAKEFQKWTYGVLRQLRQSSGLEGFEIFRMLDKEHQKEMMGKLSSALRNPVRIDFIKANTIANKAVSLKHGYPKMMKKADMTPDMLVDRQALLEGTVSLMSVVEKYHLDISVSEKIYNEAMNKNQTAS